MTTPVVVLPVSKPDFHLACKWLKWVSALGCQPGSTPFDLLVVVANSVEPEHIAEIPIPAPESAILCSIIRVRERYERPDLGYAAAANHLFRSCLEAAEEHYSGYPVIFCEADTTPTRPTWFADIAAEYAACGRPFMGDYHWEGAIPHMTGNAVYAHNWRQLAPSLAALPGPRPEQGWDTSCAHQTVPQMARASTIQQQWICPPFTDENVVRILRRDTALFHRCKDGTLIDVLARRLGIPPIPLGVPLCAPVGRSAQPATLTASVAPRRPVVQILIVTHAKDIDFLKYCLQSIRQFATGFAGVTLVVPDHERRLFEWVRDLARVEFFHQPEGKGMLAHEREICRADEWCPNAEFILHLDADCMFFRPVRPEDYVIGGRCLAVRESYAKITNPNRHVWKKCVEDAVGITPQFDAMLRHPQVHPARVYKETRAQITLHTGVMWDDYILSCRNEFPQSFAEFPTLAAVGWSAFPDAYQFSDYDKSADAALCCMSEGDFQYLYRRDREHLVEFWSHGGIVRYKTQAEAILSGKCPAYFVK